MYRFRWHGVATMSLIWMASPATAQFVWLVPEPDIADAMVHVHTSEGLGLDRPEALDKVATTQMWRICEWKKFEPVTIHKDGNSVWATVVAKAPGSTYCLSYDCGISAQMDAAERIVAHAKAQTSAEPATWRPFFAIRSVSRWRLSRSARTQNTALPFYHQGDHYQRRESKYLVRILVRSLAKPMKTVAPLSTCRSRDCMAYGQVRRPKYRASSRGGHTHGQHGCRLSRFLLRSCPP